MRTLLRFCLALAVGLSVFAAPVHAGFLYIADEDGNGIWAFRILENGELKPVKGSPFASGRFPVSMAVDFWRGILYAVNRGDDTVSAYRIRPNGRLVPLAVSNAGIMPYGIAIDPFGRFLYVTNIDQPNPEPFGPVSHVSAYRIGIDGTLTPVPGSPFPAGYSPLSVAADPLGRFVYVGNAGSQEEVSETISGYQVGGDGTLIPLPGSPFRDGESPQEILPDPLGRFVYTAGEYDLAFLTYRITGTGIPAYLPGSSFRLGGGYSPYNTLAVDTLGRFAYQSSAEGDPLKGTVSVYQVGANGPTVASSFISTPFIDSMVVELSGEFLYAQTGQAISVYRIAGNGNLIPVGLPFQLGFSPQAMVVAPARELILEEAP